MSYFEPHCSRCGREFTVGDKAEVVVMGEIYMMDLTGLQPQARITERRVLACEAPCV